MVPFAEVVLLTAMEYNREDKKKGKKKKRAKKKAKKLQTTSLVVAPVDENLPIAEIKKGKPCLYCGIPSLKTLGEFVFNSEQNIIIFFSRVEGATSDCGHQLLCLFWSRFDVLSSDLAID